MRLKIYSVLDSATAAFLPPFFMRADGEALRSFMDALGSGDHQFSKHPRDFTLYYIGVFDDNSGEIEIPDVPLKLANGIELTGEQEDGEFPPERDATRLFEGPNSGNTPV